MNLGDQMRELPNHMSIDGLSGNPFILILARDGLFNYVGSAVRSLYGARVAPFPESEIVRSWP
jgi:hypothetical protein